MQRLYAVCLVKNEDDVIEQTLVHAAKYCEKIIVLDNGSSDRTWDIVRELALRDPRVVPYMQTLLPYDDGLRAIAYNAFNKELTDKDWWLILDGDEFLAEDPQPVIEEAEHRGADIIRGWHAQFYFTERDYALYMAGKDDRSQPIAQRRRYYSINWQELRLFRNRPDAEWDTRLGTTVPNGLKKICRRPVLIRHYQYRDPEQIEKRLKLRHGLQSFAAHVRRQEWRSVIRPSRSLQYYREGHPLQFTWRGVGRCYWKRLYYGISGPLKSVSRRLQRPFSQSYQGRFTSYASFRRRQQ